MLILSIRRNPMLTVVLSGSTLLFAAVLLAGVPVPNAQTPQQVADTLGSIVQPRFQRLKIERLKTTR